MTALLSVALLVISAFTIDFGLAYSTKRQLSTAADSASLAGVAIYKRDFVGKCSAGALAGQPLIRQAAESAADAMFVANYPPGAATEGTITDVRCKGNGIEVVYLATGQSDSPIGTLAGGTGTISTGGKAAASFGVTGRCSMCFLGPVQAGNADFSVTGGDIHVNGSITAGPNSEWTAESEISLVGTVTGGQFDPAHTQGTIIPDPYASMVQPLSEAGLSPKANPCTDGPGIYAGDFEFPTTTCNLAAGAYVVKGKWGWKNNSVISGTGVTLYVKSPGYLDFKNGSAVGFSAPVTGPPVGAPPGWPSGFAIVYDRLNTNPMYMQGNGDVNVTGIIYLPKSKIDFNGNSCLNVHNGALAAAGVIKANGQKSCVELTDALLAGPGVPGKLHLSE